MVLTSAFFRPFLFRLFKHLTDLTNDSEYFTFEIYFGGSRSELPFFLLKIKMNHLVKPKVLWQATLQRDRSSRGKSCLEQGKNFAFELELQNSKFNFSIFETSWVAQFLLSSFKPHASSSLPPSSLLSPSVQTQANIRRSWSKGEPIKTHRSILLYFTNLAS